MARRMSTDAVPADETLLRLAVLLQAGATPIRAWHYLADSGDPAAVRVRTAIDSGAPLIAAIATVADGHTLRRSRRVEFSQVMAVAAWRDIAAAWEVATTVGAPLAESLRSLATSLRDAQEAADDVRVALAEPAATARLMGWLPLVAVLLGVALGFDTFGMLVGNPIGIACLAAGALLIFLGQRWNAVLVRRARAGAGIPGLQAELLAIALSGGVSIDRARMLVTNPSATATTTAMHTATSTAMDAATDSVLALSRSAGAPAVELLRASAAMARHRARIDGRLRAARLSSRLLLPLGVCTLPAFLLLGVAPMLLSVMTVVPLSL